MPFFNWKNGRLVNTQNKFAQTEASKQNEIDAEKAKAWAEAKERLDAMPASDVTPEPRPIEQVIKLENADDQMSFVVHHLIAIKQDIEETKAVLSAMSAKMLWLDKAISEAEAKLKADKQEGETT